MSDIDRSHLPIRRPSFSGVANKTLDGSKPDWNLIGHPTPPGGCTERSSRPHRRRRIREPEHVWWTDPDAELHPDREGGDPLQPVPRHRAVLTDPSITADRPEQPCSRLRFRR